MLRPIAALLVAAAASLALAGCTGPSPVSTVGKVDFATPLAIPPLAEGTVDAAGAVTVDLTARSGATQFLPGTPTETSGFVSDGAGSDVAPSPYLGPTIVAERGDDLRVNVTNDLADPTTVHWHGMHLPPEMDGNPHQLIEPGESWTPHWTIDQPAATLWYHPHPHGETQDQVSEGLAGMVILRDDVEAALPLPRTYGVDDIPVIVQDARFDEENQLVTDVSGFIGPVGDQLLVNGTVGPYLDVTTDVVRLRLLNASPARIYDFALADDRDLALIATDGGLLEAPVATDHVRLSPGERAEVLVRLSPGETVVLQSRNPGLGLNPVLNGSNTGSDSFDVLELRASTSLSSVGTVPTTLAPIERYDESAATAERTFRLDEKDINGQQMDMGRVDEIVTVGSTEIWTVQNEMALPHSFHIHDVQFQVLSVNGAPPPPELAGWKDTIYTEPEVEYRLIMRFEDYSSETVPYMYHCHLLAHEDDGMMGQFLVVAPGSDVRDGTIQGENHDDHDHEH